MGVYVPNKSKPEKCAMCPAYCLLTVPTFWDVPGPFQKVEAHCVLLDKHIESINEVLDDCPLIDIVTCGECKWFIKQGEGNVGKCKYRTRPMLYCLPTDFCSYGERRTDENN